MLIGIHGLKGSGKDTFAEMIFRMSGAPRINFFKMAYADPLKKMASVIYGIPLGHFYDEELKEQPYDDSGQTRRDLLCALSEVVKDIHGSTYFRDLVSARVSKLPKGAIAIVTDVRYEFEADWIRRAHGTIVQISRPGCVTGEHDSEHGIAPHPDDYYVVNDGTKEDLLEQASEFTVFMNELTIHRNTV